MAFVSMLLVCACADVTERAITDDGTSWCDEMATKQEPSLTDIKRAIPAYCFQPHLAYSLFFVARALSLCVLLSYGLYISRMYLGSHVLINICYILAQGTLAWGIFTLGYSPSFSTTCIIHRDRHVSIDPFLSIDRSDISIDL
jgi:hypothetical protein